MFSVDYATLRQLIQQFTYTGVFRAYIVNPQLSSDEGYLELQAKEGVSIACRFVSKEGSVYIMDHWETRLTQFGILNWELTASTEAMPQRIPPASESSPRQPSGALPRSTYATTPRHTDDLPSYQTRQWPMLYRQVYNLIDGKRQPADIALTLHKSQQEIAQVIDELRRKGLIEFK